MSIGSRRALVGVFLAAGVAVVVWQMVAGLTGDDLVFLTVGIELAIVGSVLVLRVAENRVSWLIFVLAASLFLTGAGELLVPSASYYLTGILLFAVLIPGFVVLLPLWFPTGSPPTPGWRWVGRVCLVGVVALLAGTVAEGGVDIEQCESVGTCAALGGIAAVLVAGVAAMVSLVVRWRRSSGVERAQLRWLVPSFLILGIGFVAEFGGAQDSLISVVFGTAGMLAVPISIGIAVLRYRLYEIDRVISRTVGYTLVVLALGSVYAVGAIWLPSQLIGDRPPLFVAGSTLAVAALFNPLRGRILSWVDRRFHRSRYDAARVVEEFSARLRDEVDVNRLIDDLTTVVSETMQPSSVGVWLRQR